MQKGAVIMQRENPELTSEELRRLSEIDIRTADKKALVDIDDVNIRSDLPKEERLIEYMKQIKNPYCYLSNGVIVKICFVGKDTLEQCLSRCISSEKKL